MKHALGIDIGSTTVKVTVINESHDILFSDYKRHFANIKGTLQTLLSEAREKLGNLTIHPTVTGSGGMAISEYLHIPFCQEVVCVANALQDYEPKTDVAIELGGEDAKIIYFNNGIEQRMNGVCAGGTGSFIDQMASLLQTDATGLNEYARDYDTLYPIAARCGVFAKSDIQPLINEGATKENLAASIFQAVVNQTISGLACGFPWWSSSLYARIKECIYPYFKSGRRTYYRPSILSSFCSKRCRIKRKRRMFLHIR